MRIGLVTLYDFNFGSALQCYASQSFFKSFGYDCDLLIGFGHSGLEPHLEKLIELCMVCIRRPYWAKRIFKLVKSQSASSMTLNEASSKAIHEFVATEISSIKYSHGRSIDEYSFDAFFSGSDQIWNGFEPTRYRERFLQFVPQEKRVAWAPSFGSRDIASYNEDKYRKLISSYRFLSTREESGAKLIKSMSGRDAVVLPDPVMLIEPDDWRDKYRLRTVLGNMEDLKDKVLLFFINEPSELAMKALLALSENEDVEFLVFGYSHKSFDGLRRVSTVNGGPWDFLAYLDNSSLVVTDSFHGVAFSHIFHTNYYVYSREYGHSQNQSERISSLLDRTNCSNRFDCDHLVLHDDISFYATDEVFAAGRKNAESYLRKVADALSPSFAENESHIGRVGSLCTGCGACQHVCPSKAIRFNANQCGFLYPEVDRLVCISCEKCKRICPAINGRQPTRNPPKSYIGYCEDRDIAFGSSSGGIFPALAKTYLLHGGYVFGAKLLYGDSISASQTCVSSLRDLRAIQGSKYIQSDSRLSFPVVKKLLDASKSVLYCGTSCQIAGLLSYLGREYENLLTVDLVCHGVPSSKMLNEYLAYKQGSDEGIEFLSFRSTQNVDNPYVLSWRCRDGQCKEEGMRDSAFYRLFMSCAFYRSCCYECRYSSVYKPADITLGDYYASPEMIREYCDDSYSNRLLSCILSHTEKGDRVLKSAQEVSMTEIPITCAVLDHPQLQSPSSVVRSGARLSALYKDRGFSAVQSYIDRRNHIANIGRSLLGLFNKGKAEK